MHMHDGVCVSTPRPALKSDDNSPASNFTSNSLVNTLRSRQLSQWTTIWTATMAMVFQISVNILAYSHHAYHRFKYNSGLISWMQSDAEPYGQMSIMYLYKNWDFFYVPNHQAFPERLEVPEVASTGKWVHHSGIPNIICDSWHHKHTWCGMCLKTIDACVSHCRRQIPMFPEVSLQLQTLEWEPTGEKGSDPKCCRRQMWQYSSRH